ncbi:MAG: class I SAM-dependent methyltransferase [Clostridia bacterium]
MDKRPASLTALISAYARAYHSLHDAHSIFDDHLARHFFSDEEFELMGQNMAAALPFFNPERAAANPDHATALKWVMREHSTPITLSRARYTEDRLQEERKQGVQQYVILGAGLDTYSFRHIEENGVLHIFEVDHPDTQAFKLQRLEGLRWNRPAHVHYVPVDFTKKRLESALQHTPYDTRLRSFFSWLGVSYYLPRDVVFDTLRSIAAIAPAGSSIVFDYLDTDAFVPERAAARVRRMIEIVRRAGEPMITGFSPATLGKELAEIGLQLEENLAPSDIEALYFKPGADEYHAFEHVHFACAVVK